MESVSIIANILSRLDAHEVAILSETCDTWALASKEINRLSINVKNWYGYHDKKTFMDALAIVPRFVLECLELRVSFFSVYNASESAVITDCVSTNPDTLRELHYFINSRPLVNILEVCARNKLEVVALGYTNITGDYPDTLLFPCLRTVSLSDLSMPAMYLSKLVSACPKLEKLSLKNVDFELREGETNLVFSSNSLEEFYVEGTAYTSKKTSYTLIADNIKKINLKLCRLNRFNLIGKATLQSLVLFRTYINFIDIRKNTENIEELNIFGCLTTWPEMFERIYESRKLTKLKLWILFGDHCILELKKLSDLPLLNELSLSYDNLNDEVLNKGFSGIFQLEHVSDLKLGYNSYNVFQNFILFVKGLLEKCVSLRTLLIHGPIPDETPDQNDKNFAALEDLKEKYENVEFKRIFGHSM